MSILCKIFGHKFWTEGWTIGGIERRGTRTCDRCMTEKPTPKKEPEFEVYIPGKPFKPPGALVETHLRLYGHLPALGCCEHDQPKN